MSIPLYKDSPNERWKSLAKRHGEWHFEALLPAYVLFDLKKWWVQNRRNARARKKYEWYYECGKCKATKGAYSDPYCKKHQLALLRREINEDS